MKNSTEQNDGQESRNFQNTEKSRIQEEPNQELYMRKTGFPAFGKKDNWDTGASLSNYDDDKKNTEMEDGLEYSVPLEEKKIEEDDFEFTKKNEMDEDTYTEYSDLDDLDGDTDLDAEPDNTDSDENEFEDEINAENEVNPDDELFVEDTDLDDLEGEEEEEKVQDDIELKKGIVNLR